MIKCLICFNDVEEDNRFNYKVRDHCHYMGLYRGPAHRICNLRYKILRYIPIVFHNLSGYDVHLFIRELGKKFDSESTSSTIRVTAENRKLRFIDSIRFMESSLDSLARNLVGMSRMRCKCGSKAELTLMRTTLLMKCVGSAEAIAIVS